MDAYDSIRKHKNRVGNVPDPSTPSTQMTVGCGMVWLARLVEGRAWCYGLTFIVSKSHAIYMQYQLLYNKKVSKRNCAPPNHYGIYVNYLVNGMITVYDL